MSADRYNSVIRQKTQMSPRNPIADLLRINSINSGQLYGDRCGLSVNSVTQLVLGKEIAVEIISEMSVSWIMRDRSLPAALTDGVFTNPG